MKHRLVAILIFGLSRVAVGGGDEKVDLDKLQGTWDLTAIERGGKSTAAQDIPWKITITFTENKMVMDGPTAAAEGEKPEPPTFTVKLDPSKAPKVIDVVAVSGKYKGKTLMGIYELEGDELKLCLPNERLEERPTEFKAPEGSDSVLFALKRSQK